MSDNSVDMADDEDDQRGGKGEWTPLGADADALRGEARERPRQRPDDKAFEKALIAYRADPGNLLLRDTFSIILDQAVIFASRYWVTRWRWLRYHEQQLIDDTWDKRLRSEESKSGQLMAGYEIRPALESGAVGNRSVYNWVRGKVEFEARDLSRKLGKAPDCESIETLGDIDDPTQSVTAKLASNDTPIRVQILVPWLRSLAQEMEGKTILISGKSKQLTANHSDAWIGWLALDDDGLLDATLEDAASVSGRSIATYKRDVADAFAYMLQHHQYSKYLPYILPTRCRLDGLSETAHLERLSEVLAAPTGKKLFRNLIRASLKRAWDYDQ